MYVYLATSLSRSTSPTSAKKALRSKSSSTLVLLVSPIDLVFNFVGCIEFTEFNEEQDIENKIKRVRFNARLYCWVGFSFYIPFCFFLQNNTKYPSITNTFLIQVPFLIGIFKRINNICSKFDK